MPRQYTRIPLETRLARRVTRTDTCWLWEGGTFSDGYGMITHAQQTLKTHRVAFELAYGPIPEGMLVCHTCDCRTCVRNDDVGEYWANGAWHPRRGHLWLGTPADSSADMAAKGRAASDERHSSRTHPERVARGALNGRSTHPERTARGERHGGAKLTADTVREIRATCACGNTTYREIAEQHGVTKEAIYLIVKRKIWQHVE